MQQSRRRKHKHPRPQTSCSLCHQRKVKCDTAKPCGPCIRRGQADQCIYTSAIKAGSKTRTSDPLESRQYAQTETAPSFQPIMAVIGDALGTLSQTSSGTEIHQGDQIVTLNGSPTHEWRHGRSTRGRSHSSWLLQLFDPLLQYLHSDYHYNSNGDKGVSLLKITNDQWRRKKLGSRDAILSANMSDELPSDEIIRDLVERYFDTFHKVLPVIDQGSFMADLDSLLQNPSLAPVPLLMQVVLLIAIGNATYPPSQAPIAQSQAFAWTDLASSVPTTALELGECNIDVLRVIALLNLAKQTLKFSESADYVYSGAGVRYAMMLGVDGHRGFRGSDANIWSTVRELDLHACLAAGTAPTIPPLSDVDTDIEGHSLTQTRSDAISESLNRSLGTRIKIAILVNGQRSLRFADVMKLSEDLSRQMKPASKGAAIDASSTFASKYASFVYSKFMAALHRPFARSSDPTFYLSRDICRSWATQHYRDVCNAFQNTENGNGNDAFANLISGNGTIFRIEAIQAAMSLAYELYRRDNYYDSFSRNSPRHGHQHREEIKELLSNGIRFAEKAVQTHELAGVAFLLPSLVLHHLSLIDVCAEESQEYRTSMFHKGQDLVDVVKFLSEE